MKKLDCLTTLIIIAYEINLSSSVSSSGENKEKYENTQVKDSGSSQDKNKPEDLTIDTNEKHEDESDSNHDKSDVSVKSNNIKVELALKLGNNGNPGRQRTTTPFYISGENPFDQARYHDRPKYWYTKTRRWWYDSEDSSFDDSDSSESDSYYSDSRYTTKRRRKKKRHTKHIIYWYTTHRWTTQGLIYNTKSWESYKPDVPAWEMDNNRDNTWPSKSYAIPRPTKNYGAPKPTWGSKNTYAIPYSTKGVGHAKPE